MTKISNFLYFLCFAFGCQILPGYASDLEKEKRWSEQIVDALLVGEAVQLDADGTAFLGIYTEASEGAGDRAVILLHGIGAHPDWPEIINPLRSELPEHGWSSLSIQMPILANDAALADYAPLFDQVGGRVEAAGAFLRERGNRTIVLIGHSLGASMGATYLAANSEHGLDGLVAIGMSVIELDDRMNSALALEKITVPVLDIYGSRDLDGVLNTAKARAAAARTSGNADFRQTEVEGADHFFVGVEDDLTRRVYGWLKAHFDSKAGKQP
jgi:pimeloyl-ACP methyl ester carboxylesterase